MRDNSGGTRPTVTLHVVVAAAGAMVMGGGAGLEVVFCVGTALSIAEVSGTVIVPPVWMGSTGKAA